MKSSAKKIELASVDDLFSTEESRADAQRERVLEIPLSELHPFKNHPFKVKDDESMMETAAADAAITQAEAEYAQSGRLYDARETLASLRRKHFGTVQR